MTYREFNEGNPLNIDIKKSYTEYLATMLSHISKYMDTEICDTDSRLNFEKKNTEILENIAVNIQELIFNVENRF